MAYITYDLRQSGSAQEPALSRQIKEVQVSGFPIQWKVGEFDHPSGKKIYGVRIDVPQDTSARKSSELESQLVELPPNAENVRFHESAVPAEYQDALREWKASA